MALPLLKFFEKKYPNSFKYWVIEQKVSQSAPLYFNQPLIDKIRITEAWGNFGPSDEKIMKTCDYICPRSVALRRPDWYNYYDQIHATAINAGINLDEFNEILTEEEKIPQLHRWFPIGKLKANAHGYSKSIKEIKSDKTIAIWPFAQYTISHQIGKRSPSEKWWKNITAEFIKNGYNVRHFGYITEPKLSDHEMYQHCVLMSFFDQIKYALDSEVCIGTDSGSMWVMSAYEHPSICLMSNWISGHNKNFSSLNPIGKNTHHIFKEEGTEKITFTEIFDLMRKINE